MAQEQYPVTESPQITITTCKGDLVIRSWSDTAVLVKGDACQVEEVENGLNISSDGDLKLMVPHETNLAVEHANGDFVLKNVTGDISLQQINGDAVLVGVGNVKINHINNDLSAKNLQANLSAGEIRGDAILRNVNDVTLKTISGDLSARFVNGVVHISEAGGDVGLRTVNGDVTIEKGQRDVSLRNLGGKNNVTGIAGDIRLRGSLTPQEHTFIADRDIIVRWPQGEPINFTATAPIINNRLALDKEVEDGDTLIGRIGDGDSQVTFKANGRIQLKETNIVDPQWDSGENEDMDFNFSFGFENIGSEIGRQVSEQMSKFSEQFETKFGPDFAAKISEKISQKAEQAAAKAERAAQRAQQQAERETQRAQRQAERQTRRPNWNTATSEPTAQQPKKASKDEQLKILNMVEKGIISPDEATTLLDALEK